MEKINIVIPVYNVQAYLPQCLDSILLQSYPHWEAILVDDGSTDHSGEICDSYAKNDSRFVVIHKQNGGAASAKNAGLDHVSGSYVAFVDSDDYVDTDWLKTTMAAIEEYDADVVEFDFDKVYRCCIERVNDFSETTVFTAESYLEQYLQNWTSSLFWNKVFRYELIKTLRFKAERRCIDDEFFTYKVLTNASKVVRIPNVLYHYRQRASSAVYSSKNQQQIANDSLDVLVERYQWVSMRFPMLRKVFLRHDIQILYYFATFSHTNETIRTFRRISRYYFLQVIRYPVGLPLFFAAVKLQTISKNLLLSEMVPPKDTKDIEDYFT